jgi:microcystin degradation protein MlrC
MTMKIAVGGIYHETHSFSNVPTDIESFRKVMLLEGGEVLDRLRGTTSEMAGFVAAAERFGFEAVPTIWAWGVSSGPVKRETLDNFIDVIGQQVRAAGKLDGFLFALHGACVAEHDRDGDGYILSRLRSLVGDATPIAITLDLHANISQRMVDLADIIVGYDTYPHVDQVARGGEAAELLVRTIRGEIKPVMRLEKPPLLIVPQQQFTSVYPMCEVLDLAHKQEARALAITVSGGFAYSDTEDAGPSVLVVTDNQPELAQELAGEISTRMWELREAFLPKLPSVAEAVSRSLASSARPVILADVGDNIGAGTPGDGTAVLKELIEQGAQDAIVIIADSEAVSHAIQAGVGNSVDLRIGGKCDELHGEPLELRCYVKLISDGVFVNRGHMRDGITEKMGKTVLVVVDGIKIVLTEIKMPPWNLEQLRAVGIAPEREKIIVVKSAIAFRAAYEPIAGEIIAVDSPGLSTVDLSRFPYRHIRRPMFPLDHL